MVASNACAIDENKGWPVRWKWGTTPVVADLDGDGAPEVVAGSFDWSDPSIHAWDVNGKALEGWPIPLPLGTIEAPAAADLDHDGEVEVVAHAWHTASDRAYLCAIRRDGSQPPGWPIELHQVGGRAPTVADLDGDGRLETIVAAHPRWGGPSNIEGYDAEGKELPWSPFSVDLTIESSPVIADLDLDGDLDIAFSAYDRPKVGRGRIYAIQWDGSALGPSTVLAELDAPVSTPPLSAVDLAGDSRPELLLSDDLGRIRLLDHRGSALPERPWPKGGFRAEMPVVVTLEGRSTPALWSASDDHRVSLVDLEGRQLPGWPWLGSWLIRSQLLVADLDGDPEQEAFVGGSNPNLWALEQDGSPVAGWPIHTGTNDFGTGQLADLDGDGDTDIVFQGYDGRVHVFDTPGLYRADRIACSAYQYDRWHTGSFEIDLYREAESADDLREWSVVGDTTAWGHRCLTREVEPGTGKRSRLGYRIEVPALRKYAIWIRARGEGATIPSTRIDGRELGTRSGKAGSPDGWRWLELGVVELDAGLHEMTIDAGPDPSRIDRLLLTTRTAFPLLREKVHHWRGRLDS